MADELSRDLMKDLIRPVMGIGLYPKSNGGHSGEF